MSDARPDGDDRIGGRIGRPGSGSDLETQTAGLTGDGFVVLPGLCDEDFVDRLLSVSHERIREIRAALGDKPIGIGSAAGYDEIVQRSPGRWDIPISPEQFGVDDEDMPWTALVENILGRDAEHSFSGVVYSEPGTPAQYWHIDSPHEAPAHLPAHAINVLVALHDVPLEMGPTEFARGSHRLTNHLANPRLDSRRMVYQHESTTPAWLVEGTEHAIPESSVSAMSCGTCVVFDDRLMHRGLANRSREHRYFAYFSYRRRGYVGTTHFEASRSVFDSPTD